MSVLENAWNEMIHWESEKRFHPDSEEEIQCFLYFSMLNQVQSAINIKPKYTTGKPDKLSFQNGKNIVGDMHFPDLLLGDNEIVVEIKFAKGDLKRKSGLYNKCKIDIVKMKKFHSNKKRYFLLFDSDSKNCFIDDFQLNELQNLDRDCKIFFYPNHLSTNKNKVRSRKAIDTMKKSGIDFKKLGTDNAKKAMNFIEVKNTDEK